MKARKKEAVPRPTGKRYNSVDELVAESTPEVQAEYNRLKLIEVLRSLVADIEAMKCEAPARARAEMDSFDEEDEKEGWFGSFDLGMIKRGFYIQWPNLAILLEEAKQVLKEENEN